MRMSRQCGSPQIHMTILSASFDLVEGRRPGGVTALRSSVQPASRFVLRRPPGAVRNLKVARPGYSRRRRSTRTAKAKGVDARVSSDCGGGCKMSGEVEQCNRLRVIQISQPGREFSIPAPQAETNSPKAL